PTAVLADRAAASPRGWLARTRAPGWADSGHRRGAAERPLRARSWLVVRAALRRPPATGQSDRRGRGANGLTCQGAEVPLPPPLPLARGRGGARTYSPLPRKGEGPGEGDSAIRSGAPGPARPCRLARPATRSSRARPGTRTARSTRSRSTGP